MIVYLHGFNSSPQSHKAQVLKRHMAERGLASEFACPVLPPAPREAIGAIESLRASAAPPVCYVGSSLGGFYATSLVEKHGGKAVLINPAIDPHVGLRAYLGPRPRITPSRYLLLVEAGDEVLDYRRALERYAGAEQVVVQGGDHSLQSFPQQLARLLSFAGY